MDSTLSISREAKLAWKISYPSHSTTSLVVEVGIMKHVHDVFGDVRHFFRVMISHPQSLNYKKFMLMDKK